MVSWGKWMASGLLGMGIPLAVSAADPLENLRYAFSGGTPNLDLRLRYEDVEQGLGVPTGAALEDADGITLRTRLGYTTGKWNALDLMVELEDVHKLSGDFNNCPAGISPLFSDECNGKTTHSVIADPSGTELNQFWLRYGGLPGTVLKYGRQRLVLDNARFIGNVGWRQNEMTYDGFNVVNTSLPKLTINYSHLTNANNIFFGNFELDADLLNVAWAPSEMFNLVGYGYLLDFDNDTVAARRDSKTYGLRATGAVPFAAIPLEAAKFLYAVEYATQDKYKDAPDTVDAEYSLVELGVGSKPVTAKLGYEVMSGDGQFGFQTPLATLHAFNGWADVFLATPRTGLEATYLHLNGPLAGFNWQLRYYDFSADEGGLNYGDEIDASIARPINDNLVMTLKYADFSADENDATSGISIRDTEKVWLMAEYKF